MDSLTLDLEDAVRYEATESSREQGRAEENGNAETQLASSIEQGQVENGSGEEPSFEDPDIASNQRR